MTVPSGDAIVRFCFVSAIYGATAAIPLFLIAVHTCGMTPDSAALCDPTPITITMALLGIGYLVVAAVTIRRLRARGGD